MRLVTLAIVSIPIAVFACGPAAAQQSRVLKQLQKADTNHDGALSRAEFVATREKQFPHLDRNRDGFLTSGELPRAVSSRLPEGLTADELVKQFDANGDGKVSKEEFLHGPAPVFDRVDTDHDNNLTPAEFKAARAALASRKQAAPS